MPEIHPHLLQSINKKAMEHLVGPSGAGQVPQVCDRDWVESSKLVSHIWTYLSISPWVIYFNNMLFGTFQNVFFHVFVFLYDSLWVIYDEGPGNISFYISTKWGPQTIAFSWFMYNSNFAMAYGSNDHSEWSAYWPTNIPSSNFTNSYWKWPFTLNFTVKNMKKCHVR